MHHTFGIRESIEIGMSDPLFGGHLASAALVYLRLSDKSDNLTLHLHSLHAVWAWLYVRTMKKGVEN